MAGRTRLTVEDLAAMQVTVQPLLVWDIQTAELCVYCNDNLTGAILRVMDGFGMANPEREQYIAKWAVSTPMTWEYYKNETPFGYSKRIHRVGYTRKVCDNHLPAELANTRDYFNEVIYTVNEKDTTS